MSKKKKLFNKIISLCLILALVLPTAATVQAAESGKPPATLSGSFLEDGSYRVTCDVNFENISPTAKIQYEWTYQIAGDLRECTITTEINHLDFAPEEINGNTWCKCKATASYNLAFSLINDAYFRFLHRRADGTGYETWKSTLLNHTAIENTKRIDDRVGVGVQPREISGIVYQIVFSDEYLGQWNPNGKGYVRQNPVPFTVDGKRTKNTPEQLIYDCFLYLLGEEPSEAQINSYLSIYNQYKDKTGQLGLAGGIYTINQGMTRVINTLANLTKCDDHLKTTYEQYDTYFHKFTYTENDITIKEKNVTTDYSAQFNLPARYTVNDYLQTEDCKGWELKATETFYEKAGTRIYCEDYIMEYSGFYFDHAERGKNPIINMVTIAANNSTVINLYYKRNVQIADYTVSHYQLNLEGTAYELVEAEAFSGTVGDNLTPKNLAKSYDGFTFKGGKTLQTIGKTVKVPVTGFSSGITIAAGKNIALFYDRNRYAVSLDKKEGVESVTGEGSYLYGETVKVDAKVVTKYRFTRWADPERTVNGKTRSFPFQEYSFIMPANDVVLTAYGQLRENHYLTIDPNGGVWDGTKDVSERILIEEDSIEIDYPELTGWVFEGWDYRYGDGSLSMDEKTFTMGYEDTYLIASWSQATDTPYTVKHYKQELDGSYTLFESEAKTGTTSTIVAPEVKQYEGFTSPKPKMLVIDGSGKSVMNYYYERNRYTVHFDGTGAEQGEMEETDFQYGETGTLPENGFTHFGYEFEGWSTNPDGSGDFFEDGAEVINLSVEQGAEITLYAVWYDLPFIIAPDRYFSLDEAQAGKITEEELMKKASIDGPADGMYVEDYDAAFWTSQTEEGQVLVTYAATDSKGRPISAKATAYLVNTAPVYDEHMPYTRFIAPKYWRYEDGERAGELVDPEDGGVEWWSIWRNNPEYTATMDFSMELSKSIKWGTKTVKFFGQEVTINTEEMIDCDQIQFSYYFTHEDVLEVKEYVAEHGLGNALEPDALKNCTVFDRCRQREREYLYDPVSGKRVKKTED